MQENKGEFTKVVNLVKMEQITGIHKSCVPCKNGHRFYQVYPVLLKYPAVFIQHAKD